MTGPATTAIRHTGIVVQDMEAALEFWCGALGFTPATTARESGQYMDGMLGLTGADVTTAKLASPDGQLIELLRFHSHADRPVWDGDPTSTGYTHVSLTVADMQETRRRLVDRGAALLGEPQTSPDGRVIVAYCRGPERILIELVEELGATPSHDGEEVSE